MDDLCRSCGVVQDDRLREQLRKDTRVPVALARLAEETRCPVCFGILKQTVTSTVCLHRFCAPCIDKCLAGRPPQHKDCPVCRANLHSRRALRPDQNFDRLLRALYGDVVMYGQQEDCLVAAHNHAVARAAKEAQANQQQRMRRAHSEAVAAAPMAAAGQPNPQQGTSQKGNERAGNGPSPTHTASAGMTWQAGAGPHNGNPMTDDAAGGGIPLGSGSSAATTAPLAAARPPVAVAAAMTANKRLRDECSHDYGSEAPAPGAKRRQQLHYHHHHHHHCDYRHKTQEIPSDDCAAASPVVLVTVPPSPPASSSPPRPPQLRNPHGMSLRAGGAAVLVAMTKAPPPPPSPPAHLIHHPWAGVHSAEQAAVQQVEPNAAAVATTTVPHGPLAVPTARSASELSFRHPGMVVVQLHPADLTSGEGADGDGGCVEAGASGLALGARAPLPALEKPFLLCPVKWTVGHIAQLLSQWIPQPRGIGLSTASPPFPASPGAAAAAAAAAATRIPSSAFRLYPAPGQLRGSHRCLRSCTSLGALAAELAQPWEQGGGGSSRRGGSQGSGSSNSPLVLLYSLELSSS